MLDNPLTRIITSIAIGGIVIVIILGLLPTIALPEDISTAISWLFDTAYSWDWFLPVETLMYAMGTILTLEIILISTKIVMFIAWTITSNKT